MGPGWAQKTASGDLCPNTEVQAEVSLAAWGTQALDGRVVHGAKQTTRKDEALCFYLFSGC